MRDDELKSVSNLTDEQKRKMEEAAKKAAAEAAKANQPPQMPTSYADQTVPLPIAAPQAQPEQTPPSAVQLPDTVPLRSTSTTTQSGVPNMPGYESSMRSAFDAQGAASRLIADEQANQAKQKATLLQQAAKQARDEEKLYSEQRKALEADRLADERALKSLEEQKKSIDPNRVFKNQNLGQKFMGFLGLAMGGFLEGFTHGQVKNPALAIINRFVDLDIEAQREDIRQHERRISGKERGVERKGAALRELDSTSALRQAKIWEMASKAIEADLSTREPGIIRAQNEHALSVARQKQAQLENEAFQATKARSSTTVTKQPMMAGGGGSAGGGGENISAQSSKEIRDVLDTANEFSSMMEQQVKGKWYREGIGLMGAKALEKVTGQYVQGIPGATFGPDQKVAAEKMAQKDRGGVATPLSVELRTKTLPSMMTSNATSLEMAAHEYNKMREKLKAAALADPSPATKAAVEAAIKHINARQAAVMMEGKK